MKSETNNSSDVSFIEKKLGFDYYYGEVSEWLKVHAWKACVGASLPGVRISPSPPFHVCNMNSD